MTDAGEILTSIGQASYAWEIGQNSINWSSNFFSLAGFKADIDIANARKFEALLSIDSPKTRYAAVHEEPSGKIGIEGCPYHCTYAINAHNLKDGNPLWIEDIGRWYPDDDGKPKLAQGIVRIVNERRSREESLRRKSEIDELTGLANRRMLEEAIDRSVGQAIVQNRPAALLLVSLGNFDRINHIYGFTVGDEVLRRASGILRGLLRGRDLASRFSGAKFGLLISECDGQQIQVAASRFAEALNGTVLRTSAGPLALEISMGGCLLPSHARDASSAIAAASSALDQARTRFGNSFMLYSKNPDEDAARKEKSLLLEKFVCAMEEDAIRLAFQPIVSAASGRVEYHEALLRMQGMEDQVFDNADFLKPAQGLGLMRLLDQKALELAVATLAKHREAKLSINVSHDTLENSNWLSELHVFLNKFPDVAKRLVLELTESHLPADVSGTCEALREVRKLGCKTAIDDFGTGYTSFALLQELQFDLVKVDGSFTRNFSRENSSAAFLKAVRDLATSFGMKTIIEWVEDVETAQALKELGHDYFQGSLYGMPMTVVPWRNAADATGITAKTG